jgi:hypothetical protein
VQIIATDTRDKLAKLVRLLATDKDGERAAAVLAMRRTLEGAGLTFHDFAEMVLWARGAPEQGTAQWWLEVTEYLLNTQRLAGYEMKFVEDMRLRFRLNPNYPASQKQTSWMVSLYTRLSRA